MHWLANCFVDGQLPKLFMAIAKIDFLFGKFSFFLVIAFAIISLLVLWHSGTLCSLMTTKRTHDRGLKTGHNVIQSCCQGRADENAAENFQIYGVTNWGSISDPDQLYFCTSIANFIVPISTMTINIIIFYSILTWMWTQLSHFNICNKPFSQQEQTQCLQFNIFISLWKQPLQLIPHYQEYCDVCWSEWEKLQQKLQ